ncbi:MAG: nucleotidyltransferase domain-containing protein, partial [Thermodesulfobacteriota bacterium]
MMQVPSTIRTVLAEAKAGLAALYGQRLKGVVLFGSYARQDHLPVGSDIDLLVLLDRVEDLAAERERYLPLVCELSLKHDTVLSIIPMAQSVFETRESPLVLNVRREGVPV